MEKIALCIPAFNAEKYLPRLLASAKEQLIPFDEIIVYNDASTDNTAAIAKHNGVKVIDATVNKGCSYGKNMMAETTVCDWIHFHDADDKLLPDFTSLAYDWIKKGNRPDVVLFNYEYRDNETNELLGVRNFDKEKLEVDPVSYAISEQINPFCGLYNTKKFLQAGGYDTDPAVLYNEDTALHIRLATYGLAFSVEDKISIINYRIANSMSASNINKCIEAQFNVLQKTANTVQNKYYEAISRRLWEIVGPMAAQDNWTYVKKAISLSQSLGFSRPSSGGAIFRSLAAIDVYFAIWFREKMIRKMKPALRK